MLPAELEDDLDTPATHPWLECDACGHAEHFPYEIECRDKEEEFERLERAGTTATCPRCGSPNLWWRKTLRHENHRPDHCPPRRTPGP